MRLFLVLHGQPRPVLRCGRKQASQTLAAAQLPKGDRQAVRGTRVTAWTRGHFLLQWGQGPMWVWGPEAKEGVKGDGLLVIRVRP